jgi:hypothetical protein
MAWWVSGVRLQVFHDWIIYQRLAKSMLASQTDCYDSGCVKDGIHSLLHSSAVVYKVAVELQNSVREGIWQRSRRRVLHARKWGLTNVRYLCTAPSAVEQDVGRLYVKMNQLQEDTSLSAFREYTL